MPIFRFWPSKEINPDTNEFETPSAPQASFHGLGHINARQILALQEAILVLVKWIEGNYYEVNGI
jgi:hypothetical protein